MRIDSVYYPSNTVSFKSYNKLDSKTNMSVSTSFYNDLETLKKSVEIIEQNFPAGADILVYAGSNGEEAISIYSLFKHPENYNIYSIDPCDEAIQYANRGLYSVHGLDLDGFLIDKDKIKTTSQAQAKECFSKCVKEVKRPQFALNNMSDSVYSIQWDGFGAPMEKFYKLKPSIRKNIKFIKGDIRDINDFKTEKPVGGIFFRNALYHLTNNNLSGVLKYGDKPDLDTNKRKILSDLISAVDKKLAKNGVFVMGHHTQEHLYLADKYTPENKKVPFGDVSLMLEPPHVKALTDNGHFSSCFDQDVIFPNGASIKMPLIWQKTL